MPLSLPPLRTLLVVALTLCALRGAPDPCSADGLPEKPLPLTRTTVLRETDVVYVVEGRQKIPAGVEITGQKGIRIQGKNGAVLEVEGALVVHGIPGTWVRITGMRIEPAASVQQLHLDYCDFQDASVTTAEGKTTGGLITVENCKFASGGGVFLSIQRGKVNVMNLGGSPGVRLTGVNPENGPNRVEAQIYGCRLFDGLSIDNVDDVVVRASHLAGSPLLVKGARTLLFDSNRVPGGTLAIEQPRAGQFRGTTITKCDLSVDTLRIFAPAEEGKSDVVALDKCWFSVGPDADAIGKVIQDNADDPANGVKVRLKNTADRPHNLVKDS